MTSFYPEVYVEDVDSDRFVQKVNDEYFLVKGKPSVAPERKFGHVVFEEILNYIDLTTPKLMKSIIVLHGGGGGVYNGLLVEEYDRIAVQAVSGRKPFVLVNEGVKVGFNDKIGYVVTEKNEVRTIKSRCKGYVVLVINISWERPEKYIVVLVDENGYRPIIVRESS